ncbi:hypothetical protein GQ43DRAFT_447702 [Delitschia confertaspora ATCC 74209]|uniref:peptidylprolyl isomerase n=1 Tax=Delitschia confertaspora ATCC 74209 TaxID=1513339 RepID=A0A9P4N0P6_9PLEO|nr:hypothetical protein GQ43DRAFT_447702 [Delitschia confertaspora ATCC 74209]
MRPFNVLPLAFTLIAPILVSAQQLQIEVTKEVECTRKSELGDTISVHYKGTLQDGTVFDASRPRGDPFRFTLGAGHVIRGWDEGLLGMCIGEGRKLTIPPSMAYGNQDKGPIPGGSTLIFETELIGIDGVELEVPPPRPTLAKPEDETPKEELEETPKEELETQIDLPTSTPLPSKVAVPTASVVPISQPTKTAVASPMVAEDDNAECHLLGSYALIVQGALGVLALSSLVYKRWRETPRRPLRIWFFDVSKQVVGSVLLHLANILMSMLSSGRLDVDAKVASDDAGEQPNPCSFYLLNLAIDTTIGIPILVLLLKLLHRGFLLTPMANPPESIRSGNYGHPPRATWWLKQSLIYFLGLFGMKFCVFILFQLLPWIGWVGDWALRWTEGSEALQIAFVMFIFPLIMNALQYWIIDGFIKDAGSGERHYTAAAGDESDDESGDEEWLGRHRHSRRGEGDESDLEEAGTEPLKEANPTTIPVRSGNEYDPRFDGEQGSGSNGDRAGKRK